MAKSTTNLPKIHKEWLRKVIQNLQKNWINMYMKNRMHWFLISFRKNWETCAENLLQSKFPWKMYKFRINRMVDQFHWKVDFFLIFCTIISASSYSYPNYTRWQHHLYSTFFRILVQNLHRSPSMLLSSCFSISQMEIFLGSEIFSCFLEIWNNFQAFLTNKVTMK